MPTTRELHNLPVITFISQPRVLASWLVYSALTTLVLTGLQYHSLTPFALGILALTLIPLGQDCINIIDTTSRGHTLVPRARIRLLEDGRLLKLALLASAGVSLWYTVPDSWHTLTLGAILFVSPAMVAYITLDDSLAAAVDPRNIARFIANMGLGYMTLRLVVTVASLLLMFVVYHGTALLADLPGRGLFSLACIYLLLTACRSTGAILHSRHEAIGLRVNFSESMAQAEADAAAAQEMNRLAESLYPLARAHKVNEAWQQLKPVLQRDAWANEQAWFDRLSGWDYPELAFRVGEGLVRRTANLDTQRAWTTYLKMRSIARESQPVLGGDTLLTLASDARTPLQRETALTVLANFEHSHPNHPGTRRALQLATGLALETGDEALARMMYDRAMSVEGACDETALAGYERFFQEAG